MSDKLQKLIDEAGKILQYAENVGSNQQAVGRGITQIQGQGNDISSATKEEFLSSLDQFRSAVNQHQDNLSNPEDVLSDIDRVAKEIKKEAPDKPSILSRIRDIARYVALVSTLAPLAQHLLEKAIALFHH